MKLKAALLITSMVAAGAGAGAALTLTPMGAFAQTPEKKTDTGKKPQKGTKGHKGGKKSKKGSGGSTTPPPK